MRQAKVLIPIGLVFIVSIILMSIFSNEERDIIINQAYCEEYPDMLVCTETSVSEFEVVEDIFQALLIEGDGVIDESFCDNHFYGKVKSYCLNENIEILPHDFYRLSSTIGVIPKDNGKYTITTQYYNEAPGYEFHISLTVVDGIYQFSGLSYAEASAPTELDLTEETLKTVFEDIINDYAARDRCQEYFIEEAYYDCKENPEAILPLSVVPSNYTITQLELNSYLYEFDDLVDNISYSIVLNYKAVDGIVRINNVIVESATITE
ncbi:MAG: hypothetical protein UMR38_06285 [Candidatus Izemoplasma sp.]|nr:hypothetical protein [Candidatus Izemoplasma sp.]